MKVCVVGAGVSGLAAARTLKAAGHEVVVLEKSDHPGGRIETIRSGGYIFDSGATSIAPRGRSIEPVMLGEIDQSDLIQVTYPIFTHTSLRISGGDPSKNSIPRYAYKGGLDLLPKLLSQGLDVRYGTQVQEVAKNGNKLYRVADEDYDGVVLTPPVPETQALLTTTAESRPLTNTSFRSCLSICLGFRRVLPEVKYHAILDPEQRHPLTWLSLESVKCPGRAPEGCSALVAQMSPQFSRINFDNPETQIIEPTIEFVKRLYGPDWDHPEVAIVKRWRYSQPEMTAMFDSVNHAAARLVVAGDGVMGGRVEYAYESGVKAANILIGQTN